jgi:hypothetical protein
MLDCALRRIKDENSVCICGCPNEDHENYGEEGEACEHEDHECIRVCHAAAQIADGYRKQIAELEAASRDELDITAMWMQRAETAEAKVKELDARNVALVNLQAEPLAAAWSKYTRCFGEPPHGTVKQLGAMLCFMPPETTEER